MRIGITGHQEREGAHWDWVHFELIRTLSGKAQLCGFSSLAIGADQLFAECVIARGGQSIAVIPMTSYRTRFSGHGAEAFDRLLSVSKKVELRVPGSDEQAFLEAGKWIVREVDLMIAVWDGEGAEGRGGTADIVGYARSVRKPVLHLDLIRKSVKQI